LAEGDVGDDSFADAPTGPLGRAVHDTVLRLASSVRANEHTRKTLKYEATHDALTGILNRAGVYEVIDAKLTSGIESALIFVDLDWFKEVNDRHGHFVGDEVLRGVGRRLADSLREGDIVGRLGGDEFVMVCPGGISDDQVAAIAERIVLEISQPFTIDEERIEIGASVGIARSVVGDDAPSLLARADKSLYTAKSNGRGRVGDVARV
jgi:diguanylate cyclase (GGDEF)-like protein